MAILDEYLDHLNEQGALIGKAVPFIKKTAMPFVGKNIGSGVTWALGLAAATTAIKVINASLSKATRNCGSRFFKKHTPGFKICVARERIKALQQQLGVYNNLLTKCGQHKNPDLCKQKYEIQIEKCKNKILINQEKIKQILGEQQNISEISGAMIGTAVKGVGKLAAAAASLAIMMSVDKAIFLLNRTVQASFSKTARKCGIYKDNNERNICISKTKLNILNMKLSKLKGISNDCNKERNVLKCKEKVNKHILKTQRDIQILKDSLTAYKNELEIENREKQLKIAMKRQETK